MCGPECDDGPATGTAKLDRSRGELVLNVTCDACGATRRELDRFSYVPRPVGLQRVHEAAEPLIEDEPWPQ